jgi:IclR family transcriptional regulator, acetate operon repressor
MSGVMERTLGILELLASKAEPLDLGVIAEELDIPRSAVHRLLTDLVKCGYVRQTRDHGQYTLTTKLVSLGLSYLSQTGIVDIAQPLLDRLAAASGELVRLSVIDGERLTWVARAQGAKQGLRYDPDMGQIARLSCSASGLAWLSTMSDEDALQMVSRQGLGQCADYGPNAPETIADFMLALNATRKRGYSMAIETFAIGLSAVAAPVCRPGQPPIGVISIGGPTVRFTPEKMAEVGPALLTIAAELASASLGSPMLQGASRRAGGTVVEAIYNK